MPFQLAVRRFNANVAYSGLVHAVSADGWFKENKVKFFKRRKKVVVIVFFLLFFSLIVHHSDEFFVNCLAGKNDSQCPHCLARARFDNWFIQSIFKKQTHKQTITRANAICFRQRNRHPAPSCWWILGHSPSCCQQGNTINIDKISKIMLDQQNFKKPIDLFQAGFHAFTHLPGFKETVSFKFYVSHSRKSFSFKDNSCTVSHFFFCVCVDWRKGGEGHPAQRRRRHARRHGHALHAHGGE